MKQAMWSWVILPVLGAVPLFLTAEYFLLSMQITWKKKLVIRLESN